MVIKRRMLNTTFAVILALSIPEHSLRMYAVQHLTQATSYELIMLAL